MVRSHEHQLLKLSRSPGRQQANQSGRTPAKLPLSNHDPQQQPNVMVCDHERPSPRDLRAHLKEPLPHLLDQLLLQCAMEKDCPS
jgi:hypothetical protein